MSNILFKWKTEPWGMREPPGFSNEKGILSGLLNVKGSTSYLKVKMNDVIVSSRTSIAIAILQLGNVKLVELLYYPTGPGEETSNMQLDKYDSSISLEVECDGNDICGTSLSPEGVRVYLVDKNGRDGQIARNSIPLLILEDHDCGSQSLEDCANFDFDIPEDILTQKYKTVFDMNFDEAEWLFINPVRVTN
jgi:hypothetical protein